MNNNITPPITPAFDYNHALPYNTRACEAQVAQIREIANLSERLEALDTFIFEEKIRLNRTHPPMLHSVALNQAKSYIRDTQIERVNNLLQINHLPQRIVDLNTFITEETNRLNDAYPPLTESIALIKANRYLNAAQRNFNQFFIPIVPIANVPDSAIIQHSHNLG